MRGVILDALSLGANVALDPITQLLDHWTVFDATREEALYDRLVGVDIVLTNKVPLHRACLADHPSLKFISVMATGTNNIDIAAAAAQGIQVANAVNYATPSVSQHTFALILNLATQQPRYFTDTQEGKWQDSPVFCRLDYPITELTGKTLGIIGWGALGQAVARLAEAFGMRVVAAEPQAKTDTNKHQPLVNRLPLEQLLATSDVVTLHCPLTPANQQLINAETLSQMKPSAFLINTARGGLVDTQALLNALDAGGIAGAAIDVLTEEPPLTDELMLAVPRPNLLITPHNAWGAIESRQRLVHQMAENIQAYLQGEPIRLVQG